MIKNNKIIKNILVIVIILICFNINNEPIFATTTTNNVITSGGSDTKTSGGSDTIKNNSGNTTTNSDTGIKYTTTSFDSSSSGVTKVSLEGLLTWMVKILNSLVYLTLGATLVVFLYGILKLQFVDGHKPEAREQARRFMFWGIVSLFVMVSVWGLVGILQLTFFGNNNLILPQLK